MNAPTPAAALATPSLQSIALNFIQPSQTPLQQMRRARFKEAGLAEIADSIKSQGVLQPVLLRVCGPRIGAATKTQYELIAGERRWLAARRAGLDHIPAIVRELTDEQVIEAQLTENLQREDSDALYEAEGYAALMTAKHITADAVAALIGKSRSYVYARLKLRDLCPEARAALDAGDLDASKALLIARFKGAKLQKQALNRLGNSPQYSYQAAVATLRDQFMVDLTRAPFARDDATFFTLQKVAGKRGQEECVDLPACTACPHYSRNDAELQASFEADAHICTDRACHDHKVVTFHARRRDIAVRMGKTVLTGDAAKAAIPERWLDGVSAEYLDLDAQSDQPFPEPEPTNVDDEAAYEAWTKREEGWTPPTWRQLLGDVTLETIMAEGEKGQLHELAPVKAAAKLLKAQGIKLDIPQPQRELPGTETPDRREQEAREQERIERERELRRRIVAEIHRKWKGPLKQPELHRLADLVMDIDGADASIIGPFGGNDIKTGNLKEADLTRLCALLSVSRCVYYVGDSPAPLFEMAKRFKIDPAKIKKDLAAEAKAKDKPTIEVKPAKKKSAK